MVIERYTAQAVVDARQVQAQPGMLAVQNQHVLAAGSPDHVQRIVDQHLHQQPNAIVHDIDLPDSLLLPGMVNAHSHLALSGSGPTPYPGRFADWVEMVLALQPRSEAELTRAVARGIALSKQAGVAALGDVSPPTGPIDLVQKMMIHANLTGVSFVELIGITDERQRQAHDRIRQVIDRIAADESNESNESIDAKPVDRPSVQLGLEPHAPYSTGKDVYRAACRAAVDHGIALATHLAELVEEDRIIRHGTGPLADLLQKRQGINAEAHPQFATGNSPIHWLKPEFHTAPWVLAHVNYANDDDLAALANSNASVVYCPLAADYFQHVGHRYRRMLDAGVNVCLGTDSLICQPTDDPMPLAILSAMRFLHQRDSTDPQTLLAMATVHGAQALSLPEGFATFAPGAFCPMLLAVDVDGRSSTSPLTQAVASNADWHVIDIPA